MDFENDKGGIIYLKFPPKKTTLMNKWESVQQYQVLDGFDPFKMTADCAAGYFLWCNGGDARKAIEELSTLLGKASQWPLALLTKEERKINRVRAVICDADMEVYNEH